MPIQYKKFDIMDVARKARSYLTSMVDDANDYLPYWFVQVNEAPAYARHVRVDDSELVASWYEALVSMEEIVGKNERSQAVEGGFRRHLMKSWGAHGLRFQEDYPWSNTNHCAFHEMSYILGALNRWLTLEPGNREVEEKARNLVRGMRSLVHHRKVATFWSGDYPFDKPIYEFPSDIYLRDGGFNSERVTGRGEEAIRNGMVLHSIVVRADLFKDEVALDLATGMANHLIGLSRYFNWKGEFFGHVHSAVWVASGLARLSRLTGDQSYLTKANDIFTYVRSVSSEFGWVPEFAQWHPPSERYCESCCIKDMIQCAIELMDAGDYDYWDMVNKYTRNQLVENQIQDGGFVGEDNSRPDKDGFTWKNMRQRVVGGWSGGAEPNSISLSRFRSIAGCCAGIVPQGLHLVWQRIVESRPDGIYVNLPMEKEGPEAKVEIGYPNEGRIKVTVRKPGDYHIRGFDWMGARPETSLNGKPVSPVHRNGCFYFPNAKAGDVLAVTHRLDEVTRHETVRDALFTVTWRGSDVVKIDPPGQPLRLYQRQLGVPLEYSNPSVGTPGGKPAISMKPTEQKR